MLKHAHHKTYGFVSWPNQAEGSYTQRPHPLNAPSCPASALFTPPEGPVASSPSVVGFTATQRFDNAIFPVVVPRGQRKIKVKMSSFGNIPGETDQTRARGLVTCQLRPLPVGAEEVPADKRQAVVRLFLFGTPTVQRSGVLSAPPTPRARVGPALGPTPPLVKSGTRLASALGWRSGS